MKKILFLFTLLIAAVTGIHAQVTFSPATFTAQDQVTLTVDVTGTPMAGQSEAYIWIFSNVSGGGKDGFTNTSWTNSPANAKMTAAGTNKWSFTFTGTTMFSQTPGELKDFGFLAKSKDGSRQTPDYKPFKFDPLVFTPTVFRAFPSKVGQDDVITINFDQNLATELNEQRMTPTTISITAFNGSTQIGTTAVTLNVRNTGSKTWAATFIPTRSFTVPTGGKITSVRYRFNGTVLGTTGATTQVSSGETVLDLTEMK